MQKLYRSKNTGRFISTAHVRRLRTLRRKAAFTPEKIVAGRLYAFKGITVRALALLNGKRLISAHKALVGTVDDSELTLITPKTVEGYLKNAN